MFAIFLPEVMVEVAHLTVKVFVLSCSHALRPMPLNLSRGLASVRWRWPVCKRARRIFSFWEHFARASEDYMFAFLLPDIVIEAAYMTTEACLLSGIISIKYCQERQVVATSASLRRHHELFCIIIVFD